MKIALAQMKMSENMDENFEKSINFIRSAAEKGAKLVCFPEVQLTPFFAQYEDCDASAYAMKESDRRIAAMCELCKEVGIYAAPNFYIEEGGKRYDMSLLIDDSGKVVGKQKMVHIAQCEMFYEQTYYTPSEEGFKVFDTPIGKIGIVVCFDRHYPESVRTEALRGADLIIIPTANTKAEPAELFRWEVQIQAFQSSVNIAMCNRVGLEENMDFSGESIVSDYNGETVALADDSETLLIAEIDLPAAAATRARKPYTSLRKTEFYA